MYPETISSIWWKLWNSFKWRDIDIKIYTIITNKINRRHVLHEMFTLLMSLIYVKLNSNLSFRKYRSLGEFVVLPHLRKSCELFYLQLLPLHLSIYYNISNILYPIFFFKMLQLKILHYKNYLSISNQILI